MTTTQLIEQEQTRAAIEFLSTTSARLSAARSLKELAEALRDLVATLTPLELFSIYFIDPATGALTLPVAMGFSDEEQAEAFRTAMDRHPGRVIRTGEVIHVPDVQADTEQKTKDSRRSFVTRSRLWMPVKHEGAVFGAMGMASRRANAFTDLHRMVLTFACEMAGLHYKKIVDDQVMRRQIERLERQERDLLRLSSPIIEVSRGALALPLIGTMDAGRFRVITERLLASVVARRARAVILDLTGMDAVDAAGAAELMRVVRAVELLGARVLLSGISPAMAVCLVDLAADERAIKSFRTLEQALAALG